MIESSSDNAGAVLDGGVKGVIEHVRDCSDRRAIEEKLRQNEALFRTLADTAGVGIFIVKNGKFAYVNSYITNGTGYSRDELLTMSFWEIVHPDFKTAVQDRYRSRMRGEPAAAEYEFKYVKKDGEVGWVNHSVGLLEFEGGPAIIGTLQEITVRKKAEDALASEKEFLSVTVESIGDGVVSVDLSGAILSINQNALALVHDKGECGVGNHVDDVLVLVDDTTRDRRIGALMSVLQACRKERVEQQVTIQTWRYGARLVELVASPIPGKKGEQFGTVLVFHDITEKQRMEGELYRARKLESLGILAGGIAHDFNNILTGIITNLFMAKVKVPSGSETYQLLVEAEKSSFRASNLIKQLLAFSKGSASIKELVSMHALVEDAIGFSMSGSQVNYRLDIEPDLPLVEADRGQIDQVLNNLFINADQAMPFGGAIVVTVKRYKAPSCEQPKDNKLSSLPIGTYVVVAVADEGVGIPHENLEKIFDPYFTTKPQGNGLGLAIVYSIVKRHKGIVTVESTPGKGSVFSLYLPAAVPDKTPPSNDLKDSGTPAHPKSNVAKTTT
jgi:PAS domain S-box-containing protein